MEHKPKRGGRNHKPAKAHPWKSGLSMFHRKPTNLIRDSDLLPWRVYKHMPEYKGRRNRSTGVI